MLGLTAVLFLLVAVFVDLKPQVTQNFFFASNDPTFKEDAKINRMFPSGSQLIVSIAAPSISSEHYLYRLAEFTRQIRSIPHLSSVESLTDGPKNFQDAENSPMYRRLLIADSGRSSNVVVDVSENANTQEIIGRMELVINKFNANDFRIQMAGAPYVAEMIRRNLKHDFKTFSIASFLLFGVAMWALFRSAKLTLGMLATCTGAVLMTLLIQSFFGQRIGILTANLGTIIFVVTLSHLVYMTFNWQTLAQKEQGEASGLAAKAWRMTLPASSWSMVCASLGFGSLLLVPAKPLRELGIGGTLGSVLALGCAYLMYPSFLAWAEVKKIKMPVRESDSGIWKRKFVWVALIAVLASAGLSLGLMHLNTDPSLLDYFKKGQQPYEGLAYIDRNGGSNPLTLVIASDDGAPLDTKEEYKKMWDLQDALQDHNGVGTVLSLPVLLEEGKRHPFAFLFSSNHLLNIMNEPKYGHVASEFVTKDRARAAFYLRMVEEKRDKPRVDVINDLRVIVRRNGFRPVLVGGVYQLQGELAKMVAASLVKGLLWLMMFFTIVALIVGRSLRVALAMIFSLSLVPICMLGGIGLLHIPIDIISAPATNVCIGMAIDSMVHLVFGVRRAQRDGQEGWDSWVVGRKEQWRGIVFSDVIIASGFAIFAFSGFPPTQRFGLVVVAGTVVDILANLFVLPIFGGAEWKRTKA